MMFDCLMKISNITFRSTRFAYHNFKTVNHFESRIVKRCLVRATPSAFNKKMNGESFVYPVVRRTDFQEQYHGQMVADPYRWLEDVDNVDTIKFVDEQNAISSQYINSCPSRNIIKNKLKELFDYPRYGCPTKHGSNYFMYINSGIQNQYVLYIMRGRLDAEPEIFFDPNALSEDGTVSLSDYTSEFSRDGKWWAYGLQKSGSDWVSIKIKNVDTGKDLDEELVKVKFSNISWTKDNKGFFYSCYPEIGDQCDGKETIQCKYHKVYYHRLNTPQSQDLLIYETPEYPNYRFSATVSDCGQYLHIFVTKGCEYYMWYFHKFADANNPKIDGKLEFEAIETEFKANYYYVTNDGPIHYIRTNLNAPNFRIIQMDLSDPASARLESNWKDLVKEDPKNVLDGALVGRNDILVCDYISDVTSRLELRKLSDGSLIKHVQIPVGTISTIFTKREQNELFYSFTSFLSPGSVFHMSLDDPERNEPRCFKETNPKNFDPSKFVTKQLFYQSKDGTKVPMFIVHNKDLVLDGRNPCMLYGYGGFNISIMPNFSISRLIFLDNLNGVYALANIRGGGEYGQKWHDDGKLLKKQNCFDDFISAAEYLIKEKYTSPDRIVIQGGSNGGLLVGAVSNQRPDLFGCTICHVGVMDMLRFHKFTIGHAWTSDYGSSDDEQHFHNLIRYSPLHSIPQNVDHYPATLLLTADHDDRVVPLHSYKFIAQLQHQLGTKLSNVPMMIRIDTKAGHGAGKPIEKMIEEYADIYSFIINSLKLEYHD